jgi:hypothetical protein
MAAISTDLYEVFATLAPLIELKLQHMKKVDELCEEHSNTLDFLYVVECHSKREFEELNRKVDELYAEILALKPPLAFRLVCQPGSEEQLRYIRAAQFSDEWFCTRSSEGEVVSAFRSFHICLAEEKKNSWQWMGCCYTVTPSKTLSTFHTDPMASRQRWYCICCGAKYKKRFGMLIEIEDHGSFYYAKTDYPSPDLEDLRALSLEATLEPSGCQDLFDRLKFVTPHEGRRQIFRPICQDEVRPNWPKAKYDPNVYKIRPSVYRALPYFDWDLVLPEP